MTNPALTQQRAHLANLLEALQRSSYFLHQSSTKLRWPLDGEWLKTHKKDTALYETLAAINERFAKLQDTLAATMRHSALLMSEPAEHFLKVLALFEKTGVIDSIELWQQGRMARNMAAHDYETNYPFIAEHFNTLYSLLPMLFSTAQRLIAFAEQQLGVRPASSDFSPEFHTLIDSLTASPDHIKR